MSERIARAMLVGGMCAAIMGPICGYLLAKGHYGYATIPIAIMLIVVWKLPV
jgi:hypothetical protein